MSLRYTGEATMDEPALRDVERWKDKIEVRLDNRQVFFLFFGSAMVACMLFVLGVIVGKRLETRGRAEAPAIEDPLAVLDRFAVAAPAPAPVPLTFQRALIGSGSSKTKPTLAATAPIAPVPATPLMTPRVTTPAMSAAGPGSTGASAATSSGTSTTAAKASAAAAQRLAALPRPLSGVSASARSTGLAVSAASASSASPATGSPSPRSPATIAKEPSQPTKVATTGATKPASAPAVTDKPKGRFLLQLSSFPDRSEADAFARRFAAQNAYVVASEIPGKGTWYRVRVGSFGSLQEATTAKVAFERDHNVIAYVAGGGPAK